MDFTKNSLYLCKHDCILNKQCAFTRGHTYKCIDTNVLIGNNNEQYVLQEEIARWEYYFDNVTSTTDDNVNHPKHYTQHSSGIECIEITRYYDFCIGNAIKYLWRAGHKKDASLSDNQKEIEDLKKAIFYINDRIKTLEKE